MWNRHSSYCCVGERFGVLSQACLNFVTSTKTHKPSKFQFVRCTWRGKSKSGGIKSLTREARYMSQLFIAIVKYLTQAAYLKEVYLAHRFGCSRAWHLHGPNSGVGPLADPRTYRSTDLVWCQGCSCHSNCPRELSIASELLTAPVT